MKKITTLTLLMLSLFALSSMAASRSKAAMQRAAAQAINLQRAAKRLAPRSGELKVLKTTSNYEILGYEEGGFAVVSSSDLVPEVLGVSMSEYSNGRNTNFQWWLEAMNTVIENAAQNGIKLQTTIPNPEKYPTSVEPMVTTLWDQEGPYNWLCPTYSGNTKCLTGCVATAMAQVLNFHKVPAHGIGQRTIYYPQGNSYSGEPVTANFAEDNYDWEHMLDIYTPGNYTEEEGMAVAMLMRDCGVATDMEYGGPSDGSGAYSQDAAAGLRNYFGFEDAECLERDNYSEAEWMDIVYRELSTHGPLYYAGADPWQGGHAFVLHGYNEQGMVYVNWGWSGDEDGYYDISVLDPSSYRFSYGQDMIIGITSDNFTQLVSADVTVEGVGQLHAAVDSLQLDGVVGSLTVKGELNDSDLAYVRELGGIGPDGETTGGRLRTLILTDATLPGNAVPDSAFMGCQYLQKVVLPVTVEAIGRAAFSGCKSLHQLRVPTTSVPRLGGNSVFEGVPFGSAQLYVRSGMKTKFLQAAQWKEFGKKNVIEFGTSLKVRNLIRKYGEANPKLVYTVSGDPVVGEPELVCEATPTSPAGRYAITISRGTVVGDAVDFIDGYMIVQKVDAVATVGDYTREEGQPNPEFGFTAYEGLIEADSIPVWLNAPVFTTTADELSPAGEYPITVESATAESYNLTFVAGTLTVTVPTGIETQMAGSRKQNAESGDNAVYDLQGRRVSRTLPSFGAAGGGLPKGIYIVNGKKVVK